MVSFCWKGWPKKMSWALTGTKVRAMLRSSVQEVTRAWIRTWACAISGSHQWEQWWNNSWERSLSWWEEPHLFIQPHIRVMELYKWQTMNKLAGQFQQLTKWPLTIALVLVTWKCVCMWMRDQNAQKRHKTIHTYMWTRPYTLLEPSLQNYFNLLCRLNQS